MVSAGAAGRRASRRIGLAAAAVLAAIYIAVAIKVQIPQDTEAFSDEWTYAMMAQSLASDGDLAYRAEDLRRVLAITKPGQPGGPQGLFLKPGVDVTGLHLVAKPPFFRIDGNPDPDKARLFFGKAFIYPLFAAPFVRAFGLNGFLWFNALLLAAAFFAAYTFIGARSGTVVSLLLGGAFVMATVVPVYVAWMMPELFNFTLGVLAYFCWLYKYVAPTSSSSRTRWLRGPWSDVLAAAILAVATYSKITNVLMFAPMALWFAWKRDWRRAVVVSAMFGVVTASLFAANVAITGDWNYQGGERYTCYQMNHDVGRAYPFQQYGVGLENCDRMGRDKSLDDVAFDRDLFWLNLRSNIGYFVVGRYGGVLPYFFPTVLATLMFLFARRRQEAWQWFILAALVVHVMVFIVTQPYTYLGSGGSVGNRYFMGAYGAALFLFPPVATVIPALMAWTVGALFVGKLVLHPFDSSLRPFEAAKTGPLRLFPIELTNLNGLPVMNEAHRVRVKYGKSGAGDPEFQIYHFDDNAYLPEEDPHQSFWVKGKSRAEMLFKTDAEMQYQTALLHLSAGPVGTTATVRLNGESRTVTLGPGEAVDLRLPLGSPFIYGFNKLETGKVNYVWQFSIESSDGFTPPVPPDGSPADTRFLGVRVRPTIWP